MGNYVSSVKTLDDRLVFDPDSVDVEDIREDQAYQGDRVNLLARLDATRFPNF